MQAQVRAVRRWCTHQLRVPVLQEVRRFPGLMVAECLWSVRQSATKTKSRVRVQVQQAQAQAQAQAQQVPASRPLPLVQGFGMACGLSGMVLVVTRAGAVALRFTCGSTGVEVEDEAVVAVTEMAVGTAVDGMGVVVEDVVVEVLLRGCRCGVFSCI